MKRNVTLVLVAVAALAAGALAEEGLRQIGAVASHRLLERYDMSVGVTANQSARRPVQFAEDREVLFVPSHYGSLAQITGDAQAAVFWYRDGAGTLRNVVVRDPATRSLAIQLTATSRYEADSRER